MPPSPGYGVKDAQHLILSPSGSANTEEEDENLGSHWWSELYVANGAYQDFCRQRWVGQAPDVMPVFPICF